MMSYNRALLVTFLASGISTAYAQKVMNVDDEARTETTESITVYGRQQDDSVANIPKRFGLF